MTGAERSDEAERADDVAGLATQADPGVADSGTVVSAAGPGEGLPSPDALWPGDTGTLPAPVRSVLVRLVQGPYVSQATTPNLWATLVAHEGAVRSRLADLYLELALDLDREIAFARNVTTPEGTSTGLMRKVSLSFADTALLLHLRHLLLRAAAAGERAYVGMDEMVDNLSQYRAPGDTDLALVAKRAKAAVGRMVSYKILTELDADDRYEIMPILGLIVTSEVVAGLEAEYRAARSEGSECSEDLVAELGQDAEAAEREGER